MTGVVGAEGVEVEAAGDADRVVGEPTTRFGVVPAREVVELRRCIRLPSLEEEAVAVSRSGDHSSTPIPDRHVAIRIVVVGLGNRIRAVCLSQCRFQTGKNVSCSFPRTSIFFSR